MKANTPEKIYIEPNLDSIWGMAERSCESEVEYTRTDAFIKKAIFYIQQHWIWNTKMIEGFKNYVKG